MNEYTSFLNNLAVWNKHRRVKWTYVARSGRIQPKLNYVKPWFFFFLMVFFQIRTSQPIPIYKNYLFFLSSYFKLSVF